MNTLARRAGVLILLPLLLMLAACAVNPVSNDTHTSHEATSEIHHAPTPGEITVEGVMVRAVPLEGGNSAAYFTILNGTDTEITLVGGESPLAEMVEVHETVKENDVLRMLHLEEGVTIPAGGAVTFEEGAKHLMLMHVAAPIHPGDPVPFTLHFDNGATIALEATAADYGASGAHDDMDHSSHGD